MSAANQITSRNRGHKVEVVIDELKSYIRGWLNYYRLSATYTEVLELSQWVRRRVRLYDWKQWKQPRTRRRNLLALGADPATVHMATRSRKGYPPPPRLRRTGWRMSQNESSGEGWTGAIATCPGRGVSREAADIKWCETVWSAVGSDSATPLWIHEVKWRTSWNHEGF